MKKIIPLALCALLLGFIAYQNQVGHDPKVVSASPAKKQEKTVTFEKGSELVFNVTPRVSFGDSTTTSNK